MAVHSLALPLGSIKYHLSSIGGVEASRICGWFLGTFTAALVADVLSARTHAGGAIGSACQTRLHSACSHIPVLHILFLNF